MRRLALPQAWLVAERNVKVSIGCLWKRLRQLGLAQKKLLRAAEQEGADIAEAREEWRASQPDLNSERLVFIDETGAKTNLVRLYGRAPRGQRLAASVPHGHWMTTTFVAALRHDEITAPCVLNRPMDGASFLTYVERSAGCPRPLREACSHRAIDCSTCRLRLGCGRGSTVSVRKVEIK